jgi:hypothetical protein
MTDNSIVNNNNNEIDIFAEDTPEADGRKQDLKHELEEMRAQLPTIIASAPSREDEMDYTDMEVWCRKWMTFYVSDFLISMCPHMPTNFTQSSTTTTT